MPMRSQRQRRYLWATDPELARKYEDKTPKGKKLPEKAKPKTKSAHQLAYEEGFIDTLIEKVAQEWNHPVPPPGDPMRKFMAQLRNESLPAGSASTLGPIPQLVPTENSQPATRAMLEILKSPELSKVERNALIMRMQQRLPIRRIGRKSEDLIGVGLPGHATNSLNMYLAAKNNPQSENWLQRILRVGMLVANRVNGPYRIIDRRRRPEEERHSPWKISLL